MCMLHTLFEITFRSEYLALLPFRLGNQIFMECVSQGGSRGRTHMYASTQYVSFPEPLRASDHATSSSLHPRGSFWKSAETEAGFTPLAFMSPDIAHPIPTKRQTGPTMLNMAIEIINERFSLSEQAEHPPSCLSWSDMIGNVATHRAYMQLFIIIIIHL
jgi:hypothetical protein